MQYHLEEAKELKQRYGTDWMCPHCHSSMYIISKLIRHPEATKESFPCIFKCILCDNEEKYWVGVDEKWLVRSL